MLLLRTTTANAIPPAALVTPETIGADGDRIVLHISDGQRRVVDPEDVYYLESVDDETHVRLRGARPVVDLRNLGEVLPEFEPYGFLRVHRSYAVNLRRIHEIRRRSHGRDWEIKLEPPVNRVLPVSRSAFDDLSVAYGQQAP